LIFRSVASAPLTDTPDAAATSAKISHWRRVCFHVHESCHWIGIIFGLAVWLFVGWLLVLNHMDWIQEVDTQGYFLIGKSFASFEWPIWEDEFARYTGHVWVDVNGKVMAKYPPGWPLLLAGSYLVGGREAAMWLNPLLAWLSVLLIYLLAKDLSDSLVASVVAFLYAFAPMTLFYQNYPLAHCSEVTFTIAAAWAGVRWGMTRKIGWAALCGFCIGFLPLIRPTTALYWPALLLVPVVAAWNAHGRKGEWWRWLWDETKLRWRAIAAFAILFLIPVAFGAYYNTRFFGAPWHSGYHLTNEQDAFDWSARTLGQRSQILYSTREYFVEDFVLLLAAAGLILSRRAGWGRIVMLWIVPTFLVYAGYYFFLPGPVYWRFLLPMIPAVALCVCLPFAGRGQGWPLLRLALVIAFFVWHWYEPNRFFMRFQGVPAIPESDWAVGGEGPVMFFRIAQIHHTKNLKPLLDRPTSVYATGLRIWDPTTYDVDVRGYDLNAWVGGHFFQPFTPKCNEVGPRDVMHDPRRHERLHSVYQAIGRPNMGKHLTDHIKRQLDEGRQVLIALEQGNPRWGGLVKSERPHSTFDHLRRDSELKVELISLGGNPAFIYRVTRAEAGEQASQ
jgi:hypothetical protein